ncbi:hypothetical protein Q7P36_008113 [Cladosporium allicinum]
MALRAHFYSEGLYGFGSKPDKNQETRATAQARIATSAPKLTYGKHKNNLLPLTGVQFLHSSVIDAANDRNTSAASNAIVRATDQTSSDADDSPLSDAEPITGKHVSSVNSPRTRRVSVTITDKSKTRTNRLEAGDASDGDSSPGDEENASHSPKGFVSKSGRHAALPARKKSKRKSVGILRGRLPLNELVLVPDLNDQNGLGKLPKRDRAMLERDPISSSAQCMLDLVGSDDSDATPAKRKGNVSLSSIRKRLRTPSSKYKSLKTLRRKYNTSQITPTGSQIRRIVGDGFDRSELTPVPRSRYMYATKHTRKYQEPLLPDLQALSLVTGPLPDVVFTSSSQLDLEQRQNSPCDYTAQGPAMIAEPSHGVDRLSSRRVEFKSDVDQDVFTQLASVSAPRRERSISLECRSDDGDEGDDEGDDDEEADPYADEDEPEEDVPAPIEDDHRMMDSSPNASLERKGYGRNGPHLFRATSTSDRNVPGSCPPAFHRRSIPRGRLRLNEVNEPIDNDNPFEDMLLDNQHEQEPASGSVRMIEAPHLESLSFSNVQRASSRPSTQQQSRAQITRTRSILKNSNSTPHVSSEITRPESTAANTRRNSTIEVEQSRYFSFAKDPLDESLEQPDVIRKKSGSSRYYAPIEVPYSDDMVPETSPKRVVSYTDARQLHTLKRTREAMWTSSAVPVPETDLRSLTRSVSRNNGTLSQSVRRGSSMRF